MRINDGMAVLLDPLTIGARALRKQAHRTGDITYVAYLWFPWKCEFLLPPRTHTISTPLPHSLTSVCTFGAVRVPTRHSLRPNISEVMANKCISGGAQYVFGIILGFFPSWTNFREDHGCTGEGRVGGLLFRWGFLR